MGHQEEIEFAIDNFALFDKALIDISTLRRVVNHGALLACLVLLEEPLTNTLVHDNERDLWLFHYLFIFILIKAIFFVDNFVQLFKLIVNNLLTHGVADTITVDEDVLGHVLVKVTIAGECTLEVVTQDCARDNFLTLLWLRRGLSVVLAHVGVIGSTESDCTLFTLVTHVNSDEHGLSRDFW